MSQAREEANASINSLSRLKSEAADLLILGPAEGTPQWARLNEIEVIIAAQSNLAVHPPED